MNLVPAFGNLCHLFLSSAAAGGTQVEAARLQELAGELENAARLEDLTVWEDCIVRETAKGERKYGRWLAGLREGDKVRKAYPWVLHED